MKYVEVIVMPSSLGTLEKLSQKVKAEDFRVGLISEKDGMLAVRYLIGDGQLQELLDGLQGVLGAQPEAKTVVLPVEASLPKPKVDEQKQQEKTATAARESLYEEVSKNAHLDGNYLVLVLLSTVVASIGLIENNLAVIIGAMVIAPLLGPNLALSLGTALGDAVLMLRSLKTILAGLAISILLPALMGYFWGAPLQSEEILSRTEVGLDSVALALASGAAAALSLTTGLSSVLVGVMVAVALLPPAAVFGLMLGGGELAMATSSGLLLAVNVVCVNLASKLVFAFKNMTPRTWYEKEKAKKAMLLYLLTWAIALVVLLLVIYARKGTFGS